MGLCGPYIHHIDPIIGDIGGVYLWWYGASYTFGFLGAALWIRAVRERLGLNMGQVYGLTLLLAAGVLLGGRLVEVVFYEWAYYAQHPAHIAAMWLGGMSTHGILLGGTLGVLLFCVHSGLRFLSVADELAIAAAFIMGVGRLGNFANADGD